MTELYKEHRPENFKQVVGQDAAVKMLVEMGRKKRVPHTILFSGPSGCGKTTLARILRQKLKCSDMDLKEMNCADFRGIDMVRDVRQTMGLAPADGECRVWIIDECHQLTAPAQDAFLKLLEDTPSHVYFFLCTTDPRKLKKTIISRSTEVKVKPLTVKDMMKLLTSICERHGDGPGETVLQEIIERAEGAPRKALVLLNQVIDLDDEEEQMELISQKDAEAKGFEIARALLKGVPWKAMATLIKDVTEEPETIRWIVLGYMSSVALGGGRGTTRAISIIEVFRDHWYDSKRAGLIASCYEALSNE